MTKIKELKAEFKYEPKEKVYVYKPQLNTTEAIECVYEYPVFNGFSESDTLEAFEHVVSNEKYGWFSVFDSLITRDKSYIEKYLFYRSKCDYVTANNYSMELYNAFMLLQITKILIEHEDLFCDDYKYDRDRNFAKIREAYNKIGELFKNDNDK